MNPWMPYPLLRPGISLFAGMAFALTGLFAWHIPEIVPVGLLVILFFQALFPGRLVPFRFRWINGFLLNTALFVIGTQLPENRNVPGVPAGINPPGTSALWVMRVCDPPANTLKTTRLTGL